MKLLKISIILLTFSMGYIQAIQSEEDDDEEFFVSSLAKALHPLAAKNGYYHHEGISHVLYKESVLKLKVDYLYAKSDMKFEDIVALGDKSPFQGTCPHNLINYASAGDLSKWFFRCFVATQCPQEYSEWDTKIKLLKRTQDQEPIIKTLKHSLKNSLSSKNESAKNDARAFINHDDCMFKQLTEVLDPVQRYKFAFSLVEFKKKMYASFIDKLLENNHEMAWLGKASVMRGGISNPKVYDIHMLVSLSASLRECPTGKNVDPKGKSLILCENRADLVMVDLETHLLEEFAALLIKPIADAKFFQECVEGINHLNIYS